MSFTPPVGSALIVVDVQRDFCPSGSLAVAEGNDVIRPLNAWITQFREAGHPIFFSRDWHQPDAKHFANWPPHCVQNTPGAEFHPELHVPETAMIITKGDELDGDAYSAFDGHNDIGVPLEALLKHLGVRTLYIGGLATDYCVKATVLDGRKRGFEVQYLMNCSRAVNLKEGDEEAAEDEMKAAGAGLLVG